MTLNLGSSGPSLLSTVTEFLVSAKSSVCQQSNIDFPVFIEFFCGIDISLISAGRCDDGDR